MLGITQFITVIPNGVDTEKFRPLQIMRSDPELLFVGTIKPAKGVFELFRALPLILSRRPELTVRMVGPEISGVRERLLASIPASLWSRVRFDGAVEHDRLPAAYSAATVCVLPSLAEAFGLTITEAMSCGIPVTGSSLAAGPDLAQNGRDALLVDPRDPEVFASAALECLEDRVLSERLSSRARQQALRRFSWDVVAEQNRQFYSQVIEGVGPARLSTPGLRRLPLRIRLRLPPRRHRLPDPQSLAGCCHGSSDAHPGSVTPGRS